MSDMMTFPDTWEEFEKSYGFTDNEEVYTNGARLIPSFRVKQWLDHLPSVQPRNGKWIRTRTMTHDGELYCDQCEQEHPEQKIIWNFCPDCGSYNGGKDEA